MLINLSSRPFINTRPVVRVTVACWILGAALAVANIYLYTRHLAGQTEQREVLADLELRLQSGSDDLARLESELSGMNLDRQNQQIRRLNLIISEKAFSWSDLFDQLADVLPDRVQLDRVSPRIVNETRAARRNRSGKTPDRDYVSIDLSGTASDGEAVLQLLDVLYAHERFLDPNLKVEALREEDGNEDFTLSVLFLPRKPESSRQPDVVATVDGEAVSGGSIPGEPASPQLELGAIATAAPDTLPEEVPSEVPSDDPAVISDAEVAEELYPGEPADSPIRVIVPAESPDPSELAKLGLIPEQSVSAADDSGSNPDLQVGGESQLEQQEDPEEDESGEGSRP